MRDGGRKKFVPAAGGAALAPVDLGWKDTVLVWPIALKRTRSLIALLAVAISSGSVFAETGANGGLVRDAGPYRIELVVKPRRTVLETPIVLFVTDRDGKPFETSGARGHADFSSGGLKGRATLHPDAANRMKGYGLMSAKSDLRIDVSISVSGQAPQHARFEPLANRGRQ